MDILDFKKVIKELCNSERRELLEMLERSAQSHELTKKIEEARFSAKGIYCPQCGSVDGVVKFGSPPRRDSGIAARIAEEPSLPCRFPCFRALTRL